MNGGRRDIYAGAISEGDAMYSVINEQDREDLGSG